MCDVPNIPVFCCECIEHFPSNGSKYFFKPFVTILVAPVCTGVMTHLTFDICCISIRKILPLISFLLSFVWHFCLLVLLHLSVWIFSLFCFNYYVWPVCCNFSISAYPWFHNACTSCTHTVAHQCVHVCVCVCVCVCARARTHAHMPHFLLFCYLVLCTNSVGSCYVRVLLQSGASWGEVDKDFCVFFT
jgi:hypothetical protein